MKRILFLVLIAFVSCVCSYADQYVIEDLSTTTINIGGVEKIVGDKFSDASTIKWSNPKQFMRARNLGKQGAKSKKFYQAAFVEKQATSIADYYYKVDHLSTMGPVNAGKVTWHDGRNKTKYPDNRKAIVIGNSEYSNIDYLINPVGDAILVTEKLQDLGFDVATCYDGQIADMKRALNSFCDKSKGCDVALFYYAGHGLQDSENSINYLLPVNINMDEDYVNSRNCLSGLDVRDNIQKLRCKVNILLFDACRSDFSVRGFNSSAFTMEAGNNTVVMYSTSNGTVAYDGYRGGKNGPFASAFLDNVGTPGITLSATLKKIQIKVAELSKGQTPSISDNVVTDFFFEPESKTIVPPTPKPNPNPQVVKQQNTTQVSNTQQQANATTGTHNGHEWVDLGLPSGTKWATCNVGASSPSEYGDYFAWGETSPKKSYDWSNLKYSRYRRATVKFSKYVTDSKSGKVDGKKELELSDDAARINWGSGWRMPSKEQLEELWHKCWWIKTSQGEHLGCKVIGPNGNSIFLPSAGSSKEVYPDDDVLYGCYWARSLYLDNQWNAYFLTFYSLATEGWDFGMTLNNGDRSDGLSVRPVLAPIFGDEVTEDISSANPDSSSPNLVSSCIADADVEQNSQVSYTTTGSKNGHTRTTSTFF